MGRRHVRSLHHGGHHLRGKAPDVAVIGGGLIGCSLAFELQRRGASALVLERNRPVREATWAAGGMLSPLSETLAPAPFLELGLASLDRYPDFVASVREASGLPVEIVASGKLVVTYDPESLEDLWNAHASESSGGQGEVQRLSREEILEREPALSPEVQGGLYFPDEAQVDNRILGRAVARAAEAAGARIRREAAVGAVRTTKGRCEGVELMDGTS